MQPAGNKSPGSVQQRHLHPRPARDIGEALHSGAHLTALERTRVGDVRIEDCLNPLDFKEWIDGQDLVMSDGL